MTAARRASPCRGPALFCPAITTGVTLDRRSAAPPGIAPQERRLHGATGLSRETLHRTFSGETDPRLSTVIAVGTDLGMRLTITVAKGATAKPAKATNGR